MQGPHYGETSEGSSRVLRCIFCGHRALGVGGMRARGTKKKEEIRVADKISCKLVFRQGDISERCGPLSYLCKLCYLEHIARC